MDLGASLIAIITTFVVKGTVMIVAGWLIVHVRRASVERTPRRLWLLVPAGERPRARILFFALIGFAVSELTCGIEMWILSRSSPVLAGFHGIVSALAMALFALGLYRLIDTRAIHFTTPRCSARGVCGTCTVREPEGCKMRLTLVLVASFVGFACVLPLFASTQRMDANFHRFALPFPGLNAWYDHVVVPWCVAHVPGYDPSGQVFFFSPSVFFIEYRIVPLVAIALSILAVVRLARHRLEPGMDALLLAIGAIGYTYFELALYRGTGDLLLGGLGHELGELWFLAITAEFLRRSYAVPANAKA